jgi:hypothetical protein
VSAVREYHRQLTGRIRAELGSSLVGVYAGGSYALGGYEEDRSDLDVSAVCTRPLAESEKLEIAQVVRHESLPCPARGLELVVYTEATVRSGTDDPAYELNLNTGRAMPFVFATHAKGEAHWYAVDRAIVREHGLALFGPAPGEVFAPIARELLLRRVLESVLWYAAHEEAAGDDAVLNACRAWRYASEGVWSSKPAAGEWALTRLPPRAPIEHALAVRSGESALDRGAVDEFLAVVATRLTGVAVSTRSSSS